MSNEKMRMPSSGGGIVRYSDEYKSKFEIKPGHVVVLIIAVMVIEIILHTLGYGWFGIVKP
ncbi:MAG: preprotein translocase subunit Sec61beta [Candidatus Woesearchaeota archaeon]|nr:preprotein translocase subunit Sec61beta [Candidatus Woesearchaeota archaeon]